MKRLSLAILCDFPEECWPSMDLAGEMLIAALSRELPASLHAAGVSPPYTPFMQRFNWLSQSTLARKVDVALNRFVVYPHHLRARIGRFDAFHVVDHSYAALVHCVPGDRTGVYCHDLDAFRSILDPEGHPRPYWFRALSRRVLTGMQKAAMVFYSTHFVRRQIEKHGLIDPRRLIHAPPGVAEEFKPHDETKAMTARVREAASRDFVLHVGSCAKRKRIDVLLDVFAALRGARAQLQLVKVGGQWTASQLAQIDRLQLAEAIVHLKNLDRRELAYLYRRASAVLFPSESEGFGLPVIEGLACGAVVIASDIPVLREVAEDAAVYAPVGQIDRWVETIDAVLDSPECAPPLNRRLERAGHFTWGRHARIIGEAYLRLI